jgi:hypothetical protein
MKQESRLFSETRQGSTQDRQVRTLVIGIGPSPAKHNGPRQFSKLNRGTSSPLTGSNVSVNWFQIRSLRCGDWSGQQSVFHFNPGPV